MISLDTMFCLVLAAFTIWDLSSIYLYTLFCLVKPHVYVGLDGDEGDGSVELLVVVGEDGGVGRLLVNLVLDTSFTSFLDRTSECITKYEQEILIERLEGFHRFIPVSDGKEPCNGDFLKSLIEMANTNALEIIHILRLQLCY
jgi:hypothetical protein